MTANCRPADAPHSVEEHWPGDFTALQSWEEGYMPQRAKRAVTHAGAEGALDSHRRGG